MSENKKNAHAFGALDLIVLLAVAAILCGVFLREPVSNMINDYFPDKKVNMVFETEEISHNNISVGDTVYCDGEEIGVVTSVSHLPKYEYRLDDSGTPYYTESDDHEKVTFRVEGVGKSGEHGTYVNGKTFVAPGLTMQTYTLGEKKIESLVKYVETTDKNR